MDSPPAPPPVASPRCPHCGSAVAAGEVTCPQCGRALVASPPPVAPPAIAPPVVAEPADELPHVELKKTGRKAAAKKPAKSTEKAPTASQEVNASQEATASQAPANRRPLTPQQREQARKRMRIIVAVFSSLVLLATYLVLLALS